MTEIPYTHPETVPGLADIAAPPRSPFLVLLTLSLLGKSLGAEGSQRLLDDLVERVLGGLLRPGRQARHHLRCAAILYAKFAR